MRVTKNVTCSLHPFSYIFILSAKGFTFPQMALEQHSKTTFHHLSASISADNLPALKMEECKWSQEAGEKKKTDSLPQLPERNVAMRHLDALILAQ